MSTRHGKHRPPPTHPFRRLAVLLLGVVLALGLAMPSASAAPARHHPHHGGLLARTCASHLLEDIATSEATHALWVGALVSQRVPPAVAEEVVSDYEFGQDVMTLYYDGRAGETQIHYGIDVGRLVLHLGRYAGPGGAVSGTIATALLPCVEWAFNLDRQAAEQYVEFLKNPNAGAPPVSQPDPPGSNGGGGNGGGGSCPDIPGGCSQAGDTFGSDGTSVLRNGVYYGLPDGAYCERNGSSGVIINGGCGIAG